MKFVTSLTYKDEFLLSTNDYYLKVASYIQSQGIAPAIMTSEKFRFHLFLTTLKMALAAYNLWRNSYKTLLR